MTAGVDVSDSAAPWVVLKFGGTSVSTAENWQTIRSLVEERIDQGHRPLVVCSALSQVSNQLEELLEEAVAGGDLTPGLDGLRHQHADLASELGLHPASILDELKDLERLLIGVALTEEATPRTRARIMATGEYLSTRLGAAWMQDQGVDLAWRDATELLRSEPPETSADDRRYLSAVCAESFDFHSREELDSIEERAVLTQGFVAGDTNGDTVVLGRGGSDTSASYLATRLGARRVEIWTDVPGLFTANPRRFGGARIRRNLGYSEAAELASRGAKVLHPRCLRPLEREGIPLHIRSSRMPEDPGTVIASEPRPAPGVLGVVTREDLVFVDIDIDGSWQAVGVIADVARRFSTLGLSIDVLASSPTHVSVGLDPMANHLEEETLDTLLASLAEMGDASIGEPATSVSIVGTSIADVLHQLGPLLEVFEDETIRLVSHAANDRSLTIVVNQTAADRVVGLVHERLLERWSSDPSLGPSWLELVGERSRP